jgi:hypothetical protein
MSFIETGKKQNKETGNRAVQNELKGIGTKAMLWAVVVRHKFFLVSTWAVFITLIHIFPPAADLIPTIVDLVQGK